MSVGAKLKQNLGPDELARLFGGNSADVEAWCGRYLSEIDLSFEWLEGADRDAVILEAIKCLQPGAVSVAGPERLPAWEKGWSENFNEFIAAGCDVEALVPKFVRPREVMRLDGNYMRPTNPNFFRDYIKIFRAWLAQRFMTDASAIYEFGCGPGSHIAFLAQTFPDKAIVGLDWAQASQKILEAMANHHGWAVTGRNFDFFNPDKAITLPPNTVVMTFGALEQVGEKWGAFIDYILSNKPLRCVFVEPFNEVYDPNQLVDYLGLLYHRQRNYLWNLLDGLRDLERGGKIVIEHLHHQRICTRFIDGLNYVVFRPAV